MNSVNFIGRVATDPELKQVAGGKQIVRFRIAVDNHSGKSADFFTIKAWGQQATYIAEHIAKGRLISVQGRLCESSWGEHP